MDIKNLPKQLLEQIKREPDELLAYYELALTYQVLGRFRLMAQTLKKLLRREPDLSLAHFLLSQAYARLSLKAQARHEQELALQQVARTLEPEAPPERRPSRPSAVASKKLEAYKETYSDDPNYAEIKYYEELSTTGAINHEQSFMLGLAYKRLGWYLAAIAAFKQVIKLQPYHDEAFFELGNTYKHLERHADAVKAYQQALRIKPHTGEVHFQLGLALLKLKKNAEARRSYETLKKLDPDLAALLSAELPK